MRSATAASTVSIKEQEVLQCDIPVSTSEATDQVTVLRSATTVVTVVQNQEDHMWHRSYEANTEAHGCKQQ